MTEEKGEKSGYELTVTGLSDMVKDGQQGFLDAYGGPEGLAKALDSEASGGLRRTDENFLNQRRKDFGANYVEPPPLPSYWSLIVEGAEDMTIRALLVCATGVLLLVPAERPENRATTSIEGIAIFVTVIFVLNLQACIEYTKAKEFRRQQLELESDAKFTLIRNGKTIELSPAEIVVGDIVRIGVGDIMPADGVLVEGTDIKIDESALTGEPVLVAKTSTEAPFVLSGTSMMTGSGKLLVVAVGLNSVQGRILAAVRGTTPETKSTKENDSATSDNNGDIELASTHLQTADQVDAKEVEKANAGSNLQEKLNDTAMAIGKIGLFVATLAFVLMLAVFLGQPKKNLGLPPVDIANSIISFFLVGVTILVVAVPEGLPLAVVLSLAITMGRLMKDNNRVKHIFACETMGSATTICSDKTGTLTQNRMTIMRCLLGPSDLGAVTEIKHDAIDVATKLKKICTPHMLQVFIESALLNCAPTTKVSWDQATRNWKYVGNATECALLKLCIQLGAEEPEALRAQYQDTNSKLEWGIKTFPFSSQRKKMSWVVPLKDGGYRLFCKGAPGSILDYTRGVLSFDGTSVMPLDIDACQSAIERFQYAAMRTLALAYRDFPEKPSNWDQALPGQEGVSSDTQILEAETELVLIAIVGIEDPLRPTVTRAIAQCATAGVDVRMCTGDALATAIAISTQCGILRPSDLVPSQDPQRPKEPKPFFAMEGAEFDERVHVLDTEKSKVMRRCYDYDSGKTGEMLKYPFKRDADGEKIINQAAFDTIWPKLRVLARCQPEDKLTLVRGLRRSKLFEEKRTCRKLESEHDIHIFPDYQVVAVTGDGTNDAPALKAANVGFAMGLVGTDIAKQACDIILLDDNFASTVAAVKWGRNVYESISKFCQFQLTVNISALCAALIGALLFGRSPLAATQMLWVNVIMDSLASIALASEPPTEALLERQPYGKQRKIVTRTMWFNMLGHASYQVIVMCFILFYRPLVNDVFDIKSAKSRRNSRFVKIIFNLHGTELEEQNHDIEMGTVHFTIVFNTFVLMTLMNEFNARKLQTVYRLRTTWSEWNVFEGIHRNPLFIIVLVITFVLQIILVQFAGLAFKVRRLNATQWAYCLLFGAGSIPMQFLVNAVNLATAPAAELHNPALKLVAAAEQKGHASLSIDSDVDIVDEKVRLTAGAAIAENNV